MDTRLRLGLIGIVGIAMLLLAGCATHSELLSTVTMPAGYHPTDKGLYATGHDLAAEFVGPSPAPAASDIMVPAGLQPVWASQSVFYGWQWVAAWRGETPSLGACDLDYEVFVESTAIRDKIGLTLREVDWLRLGKLSLVRIVGSCRR